MDKIPYYVSVQAHSILPEQGDASYELEIRANHKEAERLQSLFNETMNADEDAFIRAPIPAIPYHMDSENDRYDQSLLEIYKLLYELGTEETKRHIETMKILTDPQVVK